MKKDCSTCHNFMGFPPEQTHPMCCICGNTPETLYDNWQPAKDIEKTMKFYRICVKVKKGRQE